MYVVNIYIYKHIHKSPRFILRFVPVPSPFPVATPAARPCHLRRAMGPLATPNFMGKNGDTTVIQWEIVGLYWEIS
jgi:hypothetical protein